MSVSNMKPKLYETIHTQQYETIKFLHEKYTISLLDLTKEYETVRILRCKYTISLLDLRFGNGFLNMTPNALVTKEKRSIY